MKEAGGGGPTRTRHAQAPSAGLGLQTPPIQPPCWSFSGQGGRVRLYLPHSLPRKPFKGCSAKTRPAGRAVGGWTSGEGRAPRHSPAPLPLRSVPDHPISQLLKKLQCAVYRALYPVVSRGAAGAASAPGCCSLSPDADGLRAPGSRRLRPSQSLYCVLSPAEPGPAPRPPDGTHGSPPTPPPHAGPPEGGADGGPAGPASPLAHTPPGVQSRHSSFEDLEHFLATSEGWGRGRGRPPEPQASGVKTEPLSEQLKSTVKDIHNAIGEGRRARRTGVRGRGLLRHTQHKALHRPSIGPGKDRPSSGWRRPSRAAEPSASALLWGKSSRSRQECTLL